MGVDKLAPKSDSLVLELVISKTVGSTIDALRKTLVPEAAD